MACCLSCDDVEVCGEWAAPSCCSLEGDSQDERDEVLGEGVVCWHGDGRGGVEDDVLQVEQLLVFLHQVLWQVSLEEEQGYS